MKDGFAPALDLVLRPDFGGQTLHVTPGDPGGATAFDIILDTADAYAAKHGLPPITVADMATWTRDTPIIAAIYREGFWDAVSADLLPVGVDLMCFEHAVGSGPGRATRLLQHVVGVPEDGAIGPATLAAVVRLDPIALIGALHDARELYYARLPTFHLFGRGWDRRNDVDRAAATAEARKAAIVRGGLSTGAPPPSWRERAAALIASYGGVML